MSLVFATIAKHLTLWTLGRVWNYPCRNINSNKFDSTRIVELNQNWKLKIGKAPTVRRSKIWWAKPAWPGLMHWFSKKIWLGAKEQKCITIQINLGELKPPPQIRRTRRPSRLHLKSNPATRKFYWSRRVEL